MELTNPINNQHMIDGLNQVLALSVNNKVLCELLLDKKPDVQSAELARSLLEAHESHIRMLSDSIRYLGGAPAGLTPSPPGKVKRAFLSFNSLRRQESKLMDLCKEQITCLTGSDESVEKLNIVRDELSLHLS